jgi:hypothetical protein
MKAQIKKAGTFVPLPLHLSIEKMSVAKNPFIYYDKATKICGLL